MSWALSCLQLKQSYDKVELVTDSEGAELLINKLHLPYTSCKTNCRARILHFGHLAR